MMVKNGVSRLLQWIGFQGMDAEIRQRPLAEDTHTLHISAWCSHTQTSLFCRLRLRPGSTEDLSSQSGFQIPRPNKFTDFFRRYPPLWISGRKTYPNFPETL